MTSTVTCDRCQQTERYETAPGMPARATTINACEACLAALRIAHARVFAAESGEMETAVFDDHRGAG